MKTSNKTKKSLSAPKKQVVLENKTNTPITKTGEKNKYKGLYRALLILINLVGFPIFALVVGLTCKYYNDSNIYKVTIYVPLIIVILFWLLTIFIQFCVFRKDKKKHRSFKHTMIASACIPICIFAGFFLLLDTVMPKPLAGATSSTLFYEDLVVDAKGSHELILSKAQNFLKKNSMYKHTDEIVNGRYVPILDSEGNIQYYHWFCEENQAIFKPVFVSFDKAYQHFNGLAIEYALSEPDLVGGILSGNIPITVLLSIILETAPGKYPKDPESVTQDLLTILGNNSGILKDAINGIKDGKFNFDTVKNPETGKDENPGLQKLLDSVMLHLTFDGMSWNVLQLLGDNPLTNIDPNGYIVQVDDEGNEHHIGACLGYQDMAWLNSVDLLGLICCLMDCRKYFYIFGVLIGLLTYAGFILKKKHLLITGEDLTIFPRSKKRIAKEERKNYFFAKSANTTAEMNLMYDMEEAPIEKKPKDKTKKLDKKTIEKPVEKPVEKKLGKDNKKGFGKQDKKENTKPAKFETLKDEKKTEEVKPFEPVTIKPVEDVKPFETVEISANDIKPIVNEPKEDKLVKDIPAEVKPVEEVKPIEVVKPIEEIKPVEVKPEPVDNTPLINKVTTPEPTVEPLINEVKPAEEVKPEPKKVAEAPKKNDAPTFVPKAKRKPATKTPVKKMKF